MESSDDRQRCPICLDTIARESEAFLDHCFHKFCYHCILQWSEMVVTHLSSPVTSLECPLCKNQYASIIHNLHGKKFQRHYIISSQGRSTGFFMSEAHLRRQAVYLAQPGHEGQHTIVSVDAGVVQNRGSRSQLSADAILRAGRNRWLQCWVQRELEALMEEEDVQIVMHHVMGVIDFYGSRSKSDSVLKKNEPVQKNWRTALSAAVHPFLFENATKFVEELERFLISGLDIAAYDDLGRSEHVVKESHTVPDAISDLKDVAIEKGEVIEVEDGEWVEDQKDIQMMETADHKRNRGGDQLMHTSGFPSTSGDRLDTRDDNCSDDVCGRRRTKTRKSSKRRIIEHESQSPVHRDKVKGKRKPRHRSVERRSGRGRSPRNKRKKKTKSLSPLRQARTSKDVVNSKEMKHTMESQDIFKPWGDRKRHSLKDIPSNTGSRRSRSRGEAKRARLSGNNVKYVRCKEERSLRKAEDSRDNSSSYSSADEDKLSASSGEVNNLDLTLRRAKGKGGNVCNEQISAFDALDAEKLDDATLEAEIHEMKLRQQALSNLMKHLEDTRRLRVESAALEVVPPENTGVLQPAESYSAEFDRYSPEKAEWAGGYDLPTFLTESIHGVERRGKERHASRRHGDDALGTHSYVEDACTLPSKVQNPLLIGGSTSYDPYSPVPHEPAAKPESGKDAVAGNVTCALKLPVRLVGSGTCTGNSSQVLKPEFQVVSSREADALGSMTEGSKSDVMSLRKVDQLDTHNGHLAPSNSNAESPGKDNLCEPERTTEEAIPLRVGRQRHPVDPSLGTDSCNRRRMKIHRKFDCDAGSHSKEAGRIFRQTHAASTNLSLEANAVIHALSGNKSTEKHLVLASKSLSCEEMDAVVQVASPCLANDKASVETLNPDQALQEKNEGEGAKISSTVNVVSSSTIDGVQTSTALPTVSQQESINSGKQQVAHVNSERFKQKTMSVMRGGEVVEVSYKVYIPPQAAARAARRKLHR